VRPTEHIDVEILTERKRKISPTKSQKSTKKPNIISRNKFGRTITPTNRVDQNSEIDENSDFDDYSDVDESSEVDETSKVGENKVGLFGAKGRTIKCRFCSKEYQHIKARNKHLISDHFEECRKVNSGFSDLNLSNYSYVWLEQKLINSSAYLGSFKHLTTL
jgi:hypothetical protein